MYPLIRALSDRTPCSLLITTGYVNFDVTGRSLHSMQNKLKKMKGGGEEKPETINFPRHYLKIQRQTAAGRVERKILRRAGSLCLSCLIAE